MTDEPQVVSISSQTGLHPEEIARRTFPALRRGGVDGEAVRRFLETVATEMQLLVDREQSLRRRLADVERRAAEPPKLDEHSLLEAVGAETAKILQAAHDAAAEVVAKAEGRAEEILSEADAVLAQQTTAAEAQSSALLVAARSEAQLLVEQAKGEAVALLDATRAECRRIVYEARQVRTSVLTDLTNKRRDLRVQLEQLRAGRDTLVGVVDAVASAVGDVRERLENAERDAREAAEDAGEEAAADSEETELFDLEADGLRVEGLVFDDTASLEEGEREETERRPMVSILSAEEADLLVDEGLAGELEIESVPSSDQSRRSVDELFARIRAGRRQSMDDAVATDEEVRRDEDDGVLGLHSAHEAAVEEADEEVSLTAERETTQVDDEEDPPREGDPVELDALSRRGRILQPPTDKLSRALKRVMRDDQNLLLEALRRASGAPDLEKLLPEAEQRARISEATSAQLAVAWAGGHSFLVEGQPSEADVESAGSRLAAELATELTTLVRHRLSEVLSPLAEVGEGAAESAGAVYREWRGSRIEGVAADFAVRAFSEGEVAGGSGALVRWAVDDGGRGCPDCDDNSLAGSVIAGEEFPTGHVHPPVHPGCRCLLVSVSS